MYTEDHDAIYMVQGNGLLDEDLSAPSERDGETFISLDECDAVSGPYKDSTPATLRRVQIVSSSPHRMPAGYFSRKPTPVSL